MPFPQVQYGRMMTGSRACSLKPACRPAVFQRGHGRQTLCMPSRCMGAKIVEMVASKGSAIVPDFVWVAPGSSAQVHVFGVDHREAQPHIGEFILNTRPDAVVVETAVTPEQGAVPGTSISCLDEVAQGQPGFFLRMFCQVAEQLKEQEGDLVMSPFWEQVRGYYRGEQLAYITALATGAKLIFGDRPKDITYRRLATLTTSGQLDEAFGQQCVLHYRDLLGLPPIASADAQGTLPAAEVIMMQEREAIMCKVLDAACRGTLPEAGVDTPLKNVVLVVGQAHIQGLRYLWEEERWKAVLNSKDIASSSIMSAPAISANPGKSRDAGVHRGMLQAMMRMLVTQEVLGDMAQVLGPVPESQHEAVDAMEEIFGSSRMMLATLPRELLEQVCVGLKCDFYEVLEPYRQNRPSNGGPAYSEELVTMVRALNFELE